MCFCDRGMAQNGAFRCGMLNFNLVDSGKLKQCNFAQDKSGTGRPVFDGLAAIKLIANGLFVHLVVKGYK